MRRAGFPCGVLLSVACSLSAAACLVGPLTPPAIAQEAASQPATRPTSQPAGPPTPAEAVAGLLNGGASPDSKDDLGVPLLCSAASAGHADAIGVLLARKADVNAADGQSGMTALHWAAAKDQPAAVQVLLAGGADQARADRLGRTALHHAAAAGSMGAVRLLLDKKADPNAPDATGQTPLHRAVRSGDLKVVAALIAAGANVNARSAAGITPLNLALRAGREELSSLLRAKGAKDVKLARAEVPPIVRPAWLSSQPAPRLAVSTTRPAAALQPTSQPAATGSPASRPTVADLLFAASVTGTMRIGEQEQEIGFVKMGRFRGFQTDDVIEGRFTPRGGKTESFPIFVPATTATALRYGYIPSASPIGTKGPGGGKEVAALLHTGPDQVERAARFVAILNALRNIGQAALAKHYADQTFEHTQEVFGLPGMIIEAETEIKDFVVAKDAVRVRFRSRGRQLVIESRDFMLCPPKLAEDVEAMSALLQAAQAAGCEVEVTYSKKDMAATCNLKFHGPVLLYSYK